MELIKGGKSKDNNIESISLNLRVLHDIVKIVKPFEGSASSSLAFVCPIPK